MQKEEEKDQSELFICIYMFFWRLSSLLCCFCQPREILLLYRVYQLTVVRCAAWAKVGFVSCLERILFLSLSPPVLSFFSSSLTGDLSGAVNDAVSSSENRDASPVCRSAIQVLSREWEMRCGRLTQTRGRVCTGAGASTGQRKSSGAGRRRRTRDRLANTNHGR